MRDPERIPKILEEIQELWNQYPDYRLMQLLLNILGGPSAYYVEDEDLIKILKAGYAPQE